MLRSQHTKIVGTILNGFDEIVRFNKTNEDITKEGIFLMMERLINGYDVYFLNGKKSWREE